MRYGDQAYKLWRTRLRATGPSAFTTAPEIASVAWGDEAFSCRRFQFLVDVYFLAPPLPFPRSTRGWTAYLHFLRAVCCIYEGNFASGLRRLFRLRHVGMVGMSALLFFFPISGIISWLLRLVRNHNVIKYFSIRGERARTAWSWQIPVTCDRRGSKSKGRPRVCRLGASDETLDVQKGAGG